MSSAKFTNKLTTKFMHKPPVLPPELVDLVIDQLCDDKPALRACSLTHRSWLHRTRHHLFRRVCLNQGSHGYKFKSLVDASPHIGRHIREVELCGTAFVEATPGGELDIRWPTLHQDGDDESRREPAPQHWLEHVLPQSCSILSTVVCLRLTNLSICKELVNVLERYFASVTTVTVDACRAAVFKEFCELPRALRRIEHLYLLDAHWLRSMGPAPGELPQRPCTLQTLVLSGKIDSATVVNWFVAERRFMALTSLFCDVGGSASALAIRNLLHALGSSLKNLGIGFTAVRDATEILKSGGLSLESCTGLQRIDIQCSSNARAASLSWTLMLLSKVASPHLRELVFFIPAANVGALNLEVLMVVLSNARYASLKRLIFQVEVRGRSSVDVEDRLRTRLSALVTRGVELRITHQPPTTLLCPTVDTPLLRHA